MIRRMKERKCMMKEVWEKRKWIGKRIWRLRKWGEVKK